jgi:hypothetical protein
MTANIWKHAQLDMDNDHHWEGVLRLQEADKFVLPVRAHG